MTVVTDYSLNAANQQITLGTDFASTTIEQILEIRNLTKNIEIYNSHNPGKHRLFAEDPTERAGIDISLAVGVITFFEKTQMDDTDNIHILLEDNFVTLTGLDITVVDGGAP